MVRNAQKTVRVEVHGVEETLKLFKQLKGQVDEGELKKISRAGANVVKKEAISRAPDSPYGSRGTYAKVGPLKKGIRTTIVSSSKENAIAAVGPLKKIRHAHFSEFGVSPHMIVMNKRIYRIAGVRVKIGKPIRHPGHGESPAGGWLRGAIADKGPAAGELMAMRVKKKLEAII